MFSLKQTKKGYVASPRLCSDSPLLYEAKPKTTQRLPDYVATTRFFTCKAFLRARALNQKQLHVSEFEEEHHPEHH